MLAARRARARPRPLPGALEGRRAAAHRHRVPILLHALARHPGHVKTRAQLLEEGYPHDAYVSDRTDRQPRQAAAREARRGRSPPFDGDRDRLRPRLPLPARTDRRALPRALRARLSRISVRLLPFNLLLVFLPVAGLLYLDVYERQLLDAQERAMVQQGRSWPRRSAERGALEPGTPRRLLARLAASDRRRGCGSSTRRAACSPTRAASGPRAEPDDAGALAARRRRARTIRSTASAPALYRLRRAARWADAAGRRPS